MHLAMAYRPSQTGLVATWVEVVVPFLSSWRALPAGEIALQLLLSQEGTHVGQLVRPWAGRGAVAPVLVVLCRSC